MHRHAVENLDRADAARKYVVSTTLDRVDWNAELVHGELGQAVRQLKHYEPRRQPDH